MEEDRQEKLFVLDNLLSRAVKDPIFRRKFFSDYDKMLKSHDMPEEISILIKKCINELTK